MSEHNWTEVIKPKRKVFNLNLGELLKYKDLIFLFVKRDFVAFYKQTIIGPFWYLLQPLIQTLVYSVIFGSIFDIDKETGMPSLLFFLSGSISWLFFSQSLIKTSNTFNENAHIFGKVYFPRLTVPIAVFFSNLIGFSIQFLMFLGFYLYFGFSGKIEFGFSPSIFLMVPLLLLNMAITGLGIGLVISSLTTKYKDFKQFIGFGVQLLMYASPVIVPLSIVYKRFPEWTHVLLKYNPMSPVIEGFRSVFFKDYFFEFSGLYYSMSFGVIILFFGLIIFNKTEQNFIDTV
jgi:lipopolysaccharide transport system permease protein